ncbi:hypothetical protein HPGCJGGD_4084 [Methylobacterium haplocladii]|nr:hypothetical protein HPGCJGGD_4084 [Methylobacterium haplocladii]
MFFALSGFLVMGSAFRTKKVLPFLGLRIIRIVPALSVEVVLSAIVLGAIYTSLPLHDYFSSSGFYSYFLNIFGVVHYTLPGVFENNISQVVNGNLWTLPAEFYSYAITAFLILSGVMFNRKLFTIIFITATLPLIAINYATGFGETRIGLDGNVSVYYFFMGVFFYLWKDKIVYNKYLFFASLLLSYFLMMSNHAVFIYPIFLTYITIFIGLSPLPQPKLLKSGDYSYGIYLYGYPISQALVSSLPMIKESLFGLLALAIIFTGIFSVFSWHVIEKRFLHLKKYLSPRSAEISAALHPTALKGTEVREEAIPQTLRGSVP